MEISLSYLKTKAAHIALRALSRPPRAAFEIAGYLHPHEARFLHYAARRLAPAATVVEVGSFLGKSSAFIASGLPPRAHLYCVDTWQNDAMPYDRREDVFDAFKANTAEYSDRMTALRGTSVDGARSWDKPIDLLFIDGDHSYEGCRADLEAWLPHVRAGGSILMHDVDQAGVRRAAGEMLGWPPALQVWSIGAFRKMAARPM